MTDLLRKAAEQSWVLLGELYMYIDERGCELQHLVGCNLADRTKLSVSPR